MLAIAASGIISMQPQFFKTQTAGRDQYVGLEMLQACAERLLAVRRQSGFAVVTSTLCNGMGGLGSFATNPGVALVDALGVTTTACGSSGTAAANASCTATITLAKSSGPAASLSAITLELSNY